MYIYDQDTLGVTIEWYIYTYSMSRQVCRVSIEYTLQNRYAALWICSLGHGLSPTPLFLVGQLFFVFNLTGKLLSYIQYAWMCGVYILFLSTLLFHKGAAASRDVMKRLSGDNRRDLHNGEKKAVDKTVH